METIANSAAALGTRMKNDTGCKKRLWAEYLQLECRIDSLSDFIYSNKFMNVDEENRSLLVAQLNAMYEYRDILKKRMELKDIACGLILGRG